MRREHLEALAPVCPTCRTAEQSHLLVLGEVALEEGPHVLQGMLRCSNSVCQREYPILDGVPMILAALRHYVEHNTLGLLMRDDLSPLVEGVLGDCAGAGSALDVHRQHLSHYAADHWGDLDPSLEPAERARAGGVVRLLRAGLDLVDTLPEGPVLDLGCSVGRSSFELAERTGRMVLGIDLNFSMLRLAAQALRTGQVRYGRRRVGLVYERRDFAVRWDAAERVDFWQCDAAALPLSAESAAAVFSLNLLDCLGSPFGHLQALAALLAPGGRAVLASPYDWSASATPLEAWVGGHSQRGPEGGSPEATLRRVLPHAGLRALRELPEVEWPVRLHDRSTVLYRSHVLLLGRAADPTP